MTGAYSLDGCRDASALLSAVADHDREGIEVILGNADLVQVTEILAIMLAAACRGYGQDFTNDLCTELRSLG